MASAFVRGLLLVLLLPFGVGVWNVGGSWVGVGVVMMHCWVLRDHALARGCSVASVCLLWLLCSVWGVVVVGGCVV